MTQALPINFYIFYNFILMFFSFILYLWNIIFYTFYIVSGCVFKTCHLNLRAIHIFIIYGGFSRVRNCLFFTFTFRFIQRHCLSDISVFKCENFVCIKTKHIFITNSICNTIFVQLVSKNGCRSIHLFFVFLFYWSPGKSKKNSICKCTFYGNQHITKSGSMCFINNKNKSFFTDQFNISTIKSFFFDIAHLLNRRYN